MSKKKKHYNPRGTKELSKKLDPKYIRNVRGTLYMKEDILRYLHFIQQKIGSNKTKDFTIKDIELFLKNRYDAEKITVGQINDSYDGKYKGLPEPIEKYQALVGHEVEFITEEYVLDEYCVGIFRIKRNLTSKHRPLYEPKDALIFLGSKDGIHCDYNRIFLLGNKGLSVGMELAILCNAFPDLQ